MTIADPLPRAATAGSSRPAVYRFPRSHRFLVCLHPTSCGRAEFWPAASNWITTLEAEFYPDYLDNARTIYGPALLRFQQLVAASRTSAELLEAIAREPQAERIQILRIFRKYVSPGTSVEMLKRNRRIPNIIRDFGGTFRPIEEVANRLRSRPSEDEALVSVLYEYKDRGKKGYELTSTFFAWFSSQFPDEYRAKGPTGAGRDVMLHEELPGFTANVPADILIARPDGTPLVVGFARYDSDRGGSQEDDRTGGNRDKVTTIRAYARQHVVPVKILFVNDGPGLLLGSMWRDYAALEEDGQGDVLVCTLKMLPVRLTRSWFDG